MKKKKPMEQMNKNLTFFLVLLLLPLLVTVCYQKMQLNKLMGSDILLEQLSVTETEEAEALPATNIEDETNQIAGIVAKEITLDHEAECIKAQCVIARTNLYAAKKDKTSEPEGLTIQEMQALWGEDFDSLYGQLIQEVKETGQQTLQYDNDYIYAAYHAVSGGYTRNMCELFPESKMTYLSSVECFEDTAAEDYVAVYVWTEEEFLDLCKKNIPGSELTSCENLQILEKDSTGYALSIQVGNINCTGEEFREYLGLNSANLSYKLIDGNVRIVTKGLGHGFGMSQYTAEKMAEQGNTYEQILSYFFKGASISE